MGWGWNSEMLLEVGDSEKRFKGVVDHILRLSIEEEGWNLLHAMNTYHDVTTFEVDGMIWNIKNWISQERSITFPWN